MHGTSRLPRMAQRKGRRSALLLAVSMELASCQQQSAQADGSYLSLETAPQGIVCDPSIPRGSFVSERGEYIVSYFGPVEADILPRGAESLHLLSVSGTYLSCPYYFLSGVPRLVLGGAVSTISEPEHSFHQIAMSIVDRYRTECEQRSQSRDAEYECYIYAGDRLEDESALLPIIIYSSEGFRWFNVLIHRGDTYRDEGVMWE